ncbi:hypothetical protein CY34DRAFT_396274 [Suillus luteus UH-Slu-Lm8-n1]|uniref:Uncharacterized protein n=1 Tax=Suillus luteus UH-Slu-Lm8-n1 TaxID=930992 RepID=A0A0D0AVH7_9AGAM|nr:hypothetical protein CY34DRAFT_396274 [Suillus luteus UH-Slu-Lm8-n1]
MCKGSTSSGSYHLNIVHSFQTAQIIICVLLRTSDSLISISCNCTQDTQVQRIQRSNTTKMVNEGRNMLNEMCCKMEWYRSLNPVVAKTLQRLRHCPDYQGECLELQPTTVRHRFANSITVSTYVHMCMEHCASCSCNDAVTASGVLLRVVEVL